MTLYGLLGFTHNGGRTLTVMSAIGASATLAAIPADSSVRVQAGAGQLTIYQARRRGALQALIAAHGIEVLDNLAWDVEKAELGPRISD
jgi:hypothetical protein